MSYRLGARQRKGCPAWLNTSTSFFKRRPLRGLDMSFISWLWDIIMAAFCDVAGASKGKTLLGRWAAAIRRGDDQGSGHLAVGAAI